eukprot:2218378-Rhodomonas_salina.1
MEIGGHTLGKYRDRSKAEPENLITGTSVPGICHTSPQPQATASSHGGPSNRVVLRPGLLRALLKGIQGLLVLVVVVVLESVSPTVSRSLSPTARLGAPTAGFQ